MAMTVYKYSKVPHWILNRDINFTSGGDTLKVALYSAFPAFNANHVSLTEIAAAGTLTELGSGNGYTTGGATLANQSVSYSSGVSTFDADDVTWTFTGSKTFRYALVYKSTGDASTDLPVAMIDIEGASITMGSGDYRLIFDTTGIFGCQLSA